MSVFRVVSRIVLWAAVSIPRAASAGEAPTFDARRVPTEAREAEGFVPPGWAIEARVEGDLNGDSVPDVALKLIETMPAGPPEGIRSRDRALVLAARERDGTFRRLAVSATVLQCTGCGGAFYGVVEAPAEVRIEQGVLVLEQDGGSRELVTTRYRFRYGRDSGRLALIGFDIELGDRVTGETISESTNHLTNRRVTIRAGGERSGTSETRIPEVGHWLDTLDGEAFEREATARLQS